MMTPVMRSVTPSVRSPISPQQPQDSNRSDFVQGRTPPADWRQSQYSV